MMDSDSAAGVLSADRSKPDSTPPEKQDDYMTYKARSNRNVESYDYYFDRLGFTDDCTKRDGLKTRISDYVVNAGVGCRFLRSDDNPKLFKELITGFLKKHGPTYWPSGCHDRSHLKEIDARKGFMCPRDAERSRSRLVSVVEALFEWRADYQRWEDSKKRIEKQILPMIDFTKMTHLATDAQPDKTPQKSTTSHTNAKRKRLAVLSDSEYDDDVWTNGTTSSSDGASNQRSSSFNHAFVGSNGSKTPYPPRGRRWTAAYSGELTPRSLATGVSTLGTRSPSNDQQFENRPLHETGIFLAREPRASASVDRGLSTHLPQAIVAPISSSTDRSTIPIINRESDDDDGNNNDNNNKALATKEQSHTPPLWQRTTLQVTDTLNQARYPTPIPLSSCFPTATTSTQLFSACMTARGLLPLLPLPSQSQKVDYINIHFTWNDKKMSLQRDEDDNGYSWDYFRDTIRRAWDLHKGRFEEMEGGCEVGVEVHVCIAAAGAVAAVAAAAVSG